MKTVGFGRHKSYCVSLPRTYVSRSKAGLCSRSASGVVQGLETSRDMLCSLSKFVEVSLLRVDGQGLFSTFRNKVLLNGLGQKTINLASMIPPA